MTHLVPLYPASELEFFEPGTIPGGPASIRTVDIETGFDDDDFISVALADYPLSTITEADSYIDFTSEPEGNFAIGPTDSVAFSASTTTLIAGDSELRFARGLLATIDKSAVTGVRFRIEATGAADFQVLAIRLLHKNWLHAPLDIDTLNGSLVSPVSPDADPTPTYDSPFTTFPTLFRSDVSPGASDPMPIDSRLATRFNTGTTTDGGSISLYLREIAIDYNTQLDLDGTTMEDLDAELAQPDFGEAKYITRNQLDIDAVYDSVPGEGIDFGAVVGGGLTQSDINGTPQFDLERKADALSAAWIEIRLDWEGDGAGILSVWDAETASPFYQFDVALIDNTNYVLLTDLVENSFQARIYTTAGSYVDTLKLDTTVIDDREVFKRRKGRLGWSATLGDGDAYIDGVEPRGLNFAEYRSHPFESLSPMAGASLEVGSTADVDLFKGINPGPWGGQFTDYPERGPEAFKIRNTADSPLQGIESQEIYFDDLLNTTISFSLQVSREALEHGTMHCFLWDGLTPTTLPLGPLAPEAWNEIEVSLTPFADVNLPGTYKLVIVQSISGIPNDWGIDAISVVRRNVEWSARPYLDDPWYDLESQWTKFGHAINAGSDVLFSDRTHKIQMRSKALRQDAYVSHVRTKPKYAELGRLIWDEEAENVGNIGPTASFDDTPGVGRTVAFDSTSTDTDGFIINYFWTFGDGASAIGSSVEHTYIDAGTFPVTLIVTDNHGIRDSVVVDQVIT